MAARAQVRCLPVWQASHPLPAARGHAALRPECLAHDGGRADVGIGPYGKTGSSA